MKQVNGQGNISDALLACSITFPIQMVIAFAIASVEEKRERKPRLWTFLLLEEFLSPPL